MLTGQQVRERLNISKDKFLKLVQTGELAAIKTGPAPTDPYRVAEEDLDDFIERNRVKPRQKAS